MVHRPKNVATMIPVPSARSVNTVIATIFGRVAPVFAAMSIPCINPCTISCIRAVGSSPQPDGRLALHNLAVAGFDGAGDFGTGVLRHLHAWRPQPFGVLKEET